MRNGQVRQAIMASHGLLKIGTGNCVVVTFALSLGMGERTRFKAAAWAKESNGRDAENELSD